MHVKQLSLYGCWYPMRESLNVHSFFFTDVTNTAPFFICKRFFRSILRGFIRLQHIRWYIFSCVSVHVKYSKHVFFLSRFTLGAFALRHFFLSSSSFGIQLSSMRSIALVVQARPCFFNNDRSWLWFILQIIWADAVKIYRRRGSA